MIRTQLKMLIAALVGILALGGGVALATAGSAGADVAARAGTCQAEKQAVKAAKQDAKDAETKAEKKAAKKEVKSAKKALKDCKANSTPDPSETPSETPTDPATEGGGTCVPVVGICAPKQARAGH